MGRFYGFPFPSVDPSGLTPRPKIYPFQQGLGAAVMRCCSEIQVLLCCGRKKARMRLEVRGRWRG
ncbi:MAG: hypothetical protein ACE5NJ_09210 [Thermodesulfobacteriota bacterium]